MDGLNDLFILCVCVWVGERIWVRISKRFLFDLCIVLLLSFIEDFENQFYRLCRPLNFAKMSVFAVATHYEKPEIEHFDFDCGKQPPQQ